MTSAVWLIAEISSAILIASLIALSPKIRNFMRKVVTSVCSACLNFKARFLKDER